MHRTWLCLLAVANIYATTGTSSWASSSEFGRYFGLRFIGAYTELEDTSVTNFTGDLRINNDDDLVAGNSAIFGYRWKMLPLRTEFEVGFRYRFDYDTRDIGAQTGYENNLSTTTGLVNAAYEFRNNSDFTPYIGCSVGWAQQHSEVERNNLVTGDMESFSNRKHNFAWGGLIGATWNYSSHWDLDLGYRYINLGDVDTGRSSIGSSIKGENYLSHDILVTINYRF